MNISQLLHQHPAITQATELKTLCQPLTKFGIKYFSYVRITEGKQFSAIGLQPEFIRLYYQKQYFNCDVHMFNQLQQEQYILWDTLKLKRKTKTLDNDFIRFDQGHTFSIIYKNNETIDCYHFAAALANSQINGVYLQNLEALKQFCQYFMDKVHQHKSLRQMYTLPVKLAEDGEYAIEQPLSCAEEYGKNYFNSAFKIDRIYLPENHTYLTRREWNCLFWLAQGKTAYEVGTILHITERTVKAHIASLKRKLDCRNQCQLGAAFAKLQYQYGLTGYR
ncbi:MAG: hypothetical protein Tsb005_09350 [Gammaproteobacteria bacterium]